MMTFFGLMLVIGFGLFFYSYKDTFLGGGNPEVHRGRFHHLLFAQVWVSKDKIRRAKKLRWIAGLLILGAFLGVYNASGGNPIEEFMALDWSDRETRIGATVTIGFIVFIVLISVFPKQSIWVVLSGVATMMTSQYLSEIAVDHGTTFLDGGLEEIKFHEALVLSVVFLVSMVILYFAFKLFRKLNQGTSFLDWRKDPLEFQVDEEITAKRVKLVGEDKHSYGTVSLAVAMKIAEDKELNLIQYGKGKVPICRLGDYERLLDE